MPLPPVARGARHRDAPYNGAFSESGAGRCRTPQPTQRTLHVFARLLITLLALSFAATAAAQDRKRVEKAADLPVFSYKVDGKLEALVRDDAKFKAFARELRRDTESVLAQYDIEDKAKMRELLGVLVRLDLLDGRYDDALRGALRIRELEEKPADKLLSGMTVRAMVEARRIAGNDTSDAYRREVSRLIAADLAGMPYDVIQNEIKEAKMGAEILSEALALGYINNVLQPTVDKAGSLSSDLAPIIVGARYRLTFVLPLKEPLIAFDKYSNPDRKSTRLNSSHLRLSRMPSSA
jgi:hypothetical protein